MGGRLIDFLVLKKDLAIPVHNYLTSRFRSPKVADSDHRLATWDMRVSAISADRAMCDCRLKKPS